MNLSCSVKHAISFAALIANLLIFGIFVFLYIPISYQSGIFFLIYTILSIVFVSFIESYLIDEDIVSYRIITQIILCTYSLPTPLVAFYFSDDPWMVGRYIYNNFSYRTIFFALLIFCMMHIGMYLGAKIKPIDLRLDKFYMSNKWLPMISLILLLISFVPLYNIILRTGFGNIENYKDVFIKLNENDSFINYLSFFMLIPACYLIVNSFVKKKYFFVLIVFIICILATMIKPSRGLLFSIIFISILSYHYYRNNLKLNKLILLSLAVLLLSFIMIHQRSKESSHDYRFANKLVNITEGKIIFENTYIMYAYLNESNDFRWGATYVDALKHVIPQRFLPVEKPVPTLMWFRHDMFENISEKSFGRMFSIVAEAYMNFWFIGPFILGIFYSYLIKNFYTAMKNSHRYNVVTMGTLL
ncbi:oligosaccharide repeat unit polymerase, partial [bacterium]|nr:oligosaccharide repeat unit polymerase [bacterium]